ncbi:alkane hydroxylase MAH1-like [Prosopis cineraria]|uniref:alkane hydroxylase MAH1-like n=1 Tax=Prosopis cineraria TaxID=364024 RepID=UPI00240F5A09|nr:alkane hydroxylase MAH1-like [Prosopis cineraria]
MLPSFLKNLGQTYDYTTDVLQRKGGTGNFLGPWFTGMNYLVTYDPMNVHRIMSKNFANYIKGHDLREVLDAFGDSIFTVDSDVPIHLRAIYSHGFRQSEIQKPLESSRFSLPPSANLSVCNYVWSPLFCSLVSPRKCLFNPGELPAVRGCAGIVLKDSVLLGTTQATSQEFAVTHVCRRYYSTSDAWKHYRALQHSVFKTKCFEKFWEKIVREKVESCLIPLLDQVEKRGVELDLQDVFGRFNFDAVCSIVLGFDPKSLTLDFQEVACMRAFDEVGEFTFYRHTIPKSVWKLSLTWFFWLVATHPLVEAKIHEEIKEEKEVKDQVYLHAALCEGLRLYPPVPSVIRQTIKHDILPSGHEVSPITMIMISLYAMGRCEEIWGKDCLEFKPERWISKRGGIIHMPSYKFSTFIAGPRTCLGKDLSFIQMKIMASAILCNYQVHVVEDHPVSPTLSMVLQMRYGLKIRITKRH